MLSPSAPEIEITHHSVPMLESQTSLSRLIIDVCSVVYSGIMTDRETTNGLTVMSYDWTRMTSWMMKWGTKRRMMTVERLIVEVD